METLLALVGTKLGIALAGSAGTIGLTLLVWLLNRDSVIKRVFSWGKSLGRSMAGKLPESVEVALLTVACLFISFLNGAISNNSERSQKTADKLINAALAVGSETRASFIAYSAMKKLDEVEAEAYKKMSGE